MIEILVGSMIASPYSKRKLTGFNLPLISRLTTHTRATAIAYAAFNLYAQNKLSEISAIEDFCSRFDFGVNDISDYDICAYIIVLLSLVKDKRLYYPEIINSISNKGVKSIVTALCDISYSLNNGFDVSFIMSDFENNHMESGIPTLLEYRNSIKNDSIEDSLVIGIFSSLTCSSYEKAIRSSLYVGGCRELTMMTIGLIMSKRNISIPSDISCFCRTYLANNILSIQ